MEAKLYGLPLAPGAYGASDLTTDFTIGRNQVVIADVNSHELVVQQNGATVATYPASYGRGEDTGDPNLITRSGIHVVNEFNETKLMSNPRYGYSNVPEKWAVRISNNGEFIHANPASSDAQGSSNVTHGCVNLSLADAEAYFHTAIWGDPVEISGTTVTTRPGGRRHLHLGDALGPVEGEVGRLTHQPEPAPSTTGAPPSGVGPADRPHRSPLTGPRDRRHQRGSVPSGPVKESGLPGLSSASGRGEMSRCAPRHTPPVRGSENQLRFRSGQPGHRPHRSTVDPDSPPKYGDPHARPADPSAGVRSLPYW